MKRRDSVSGVGIKAGARFVPYFVFSLGLIVTVAIWAAANNFVRTRDQLRLANSISRARQVLEARIQSQFALLRNTGIMFETQDEVTADEFRAYVQRVQLEQNYTGMRGLGFSRRVPLGDRETVVREAREAGFPNFKFFPRMSGEIHAITYLEPQDARNRAAVGFNMYSEKTRRAAMDRAWLSGRSAISGKVILVQEITKDVQPGFLAYFPVYEGGDPGTPELRRTRLRGFIYSPFRSKDFFDALFADTKGLDVGVRVFDGTGEGDDALLYSNVPDNIPTADSESIDLRGQPWKIDYAPLPAFQSASGLPLVNWIPFAGVVTSLILGGLAWSQSKANLALERQALDLHRREYQQRLLAQAGELLSASLEYEQTLVSVSKLIVPSFADWCAVDLLDEEGEVQRLAVAHVDPTKVKFAEELQKKYPADKNADRGVYNVLRTGKSEWYPHIPVEMLRSAAIDEEHWKIIEEIGFSSAIVAPLTARGRTLGTITLVWAESGFHYDEEDLRLAEEIAARAGVAVDNARLFQRAQVESRISSILQGLSLTLSGELDEARLVQFIVDQARSLTKAQFGAFFARVEQDGESRLKLHSLSGAVAESFSHLGFPRETELFAPTMSGQEIVRVADLLEDERFSKGKGLPPGHLGLRSYLGVPVVSRDGQSIGALLFGHADPGVFSEREEILARGFAAHAAIALDNARLFSEKEAEIEVRRRAEERIRELNENLERLVDERTIELVAANRELEAFCYSVSHDLRAPLRSVDGFSKALIEDYSDRLDEFGIDYLSRVRAAAQRMDELITALLNLSRLTRTELHLQTLDISQIAAEVAEDAVRERALHPVEVVVAPGMTAEADPKMLRIVLDNLIGNAIKFSNTQPHPRVEIGRDDGVFFIRDNGVGFNPEYSNKLFAPFERLHSGGDFPGTGIGLATVQRIIHRHGGQIWAESEEGKGATFYFTLR